MIFFSGRKSMRINMLAAGAVTPRFEGFSPIFKSYGIQPKEFHHPQTLLLSMLHTHP